MRYSLTSLSMLGRHVLLAKLSASIIGAIGLLGLLWSGTPAMAIPAFARQTGQSCVACHAGGQFPELTPYGRMFKLTGYTMGERGNPLALMGVVDVTKTRNNSDGLGGNLSPEDGHVIADFASIFAGGKINENVGGFAQWTYAVHDRQASNGTWEGHLGSDNFDLRYADEAMRGTHSLVWGLVLNNNPTVQDVWNSSPAWGYPYISTTTGAFGGPPVSTLIEGGLAQQVAGLGVYAYLDKSVYLEFSNYQTAKGFWSFLSLGNRTGNANHPLTYISGGSPYLRIAYTHDWGAQNIMLGAFGLQSRVVPLDANNFPIYGQGRTRYRDIGIDGQYQYLLDPHTITAQVRYIHESIHDDTLTLYTGPASLKSFRAKVSYVYQARYGASLALTDLRGSADSTAYAASVNNQPNTRYWTPEIFWMPKENLRIGLQYNYFRKYLGASTNYDGNGRNASNNNTAYLYMWFAL